MIFYTYGGNLMKLEIQDIFPESDFYLSTEVDKFNSNYNLYRRLVWNTTNLILFLKSVG